MGPLFRRPGDPILALQIGRASLPLPTPATPPGSLLCWGTARCIPASLAQRRTAAKRRRALAQSHGHADDLPLSSIDEPRLARLESDYRAQAACRSGGSPRGPTLVSADITELRVLMTEAREAAGLPPR